ncbi:MAG: SurA N-terminal domain-containing protein [bacterium]
MRLTNLDFALGIDSTMSEIVRSWLPFAMLFVLGVFLLAAPPSSKATENSTETSAHDTSYAIKIGEQSISKEDYQSIVEGTFQQWKNKYSRKKSGDTPDLDKIRSTIRRKIKDQQIRKLHFKHAWKPSDILVPDTMVKVMWKRGVQKAGSAEAFRENLKKRGMTEDTFLRRARNRIKKREFKKQLLKDVTASDTELRNYYEKNEDEFKGRPFEDVKKKLKRVMLKRKRNKALQKYLDNLREKVQISIDLPEQ